jgi:CheY-like chemotaxis protein
MPEKPVILVVDDDDDVREMAVTALERQGYEVVPASSADEALLILKRGKPIDVLVTDVVMPGLTDGWELAYQATQMRPGLAVLLTSGFIRAEPDEHRVVDAALLRKPWRVRELLQHIELLLAQRGGET